jgi:hypothetical protein
LKIRVQVNILILVMVCCFYKKYEEAISNFKLTEIIRNERIREMWGVKQSVVERMKVNNLRCYRGAD